MHKTNNWIELLSKEPNNYPSNWTGLKEVQLAHIYMMDRLLETKNVKIPQYKYEKGITIGAGGAKYFGCAFACFYVLRKLGCTLPVEFWYLDEYEMDNKMKSICDIFGITYVNANQYCKNNHIQPRILKGWELKPFATLYSNFKEVLYLDADNIPYKDPTYLFDDPEYKELGSMFWPDLPPGRRKEWLVDVCWHNVGLEYRDEPDFETGQYLINKEKCYKELQLTMWMNEHSDWFYKFVYGDKSTFHLAWRKCGSNYSIPQKPAGWRRPCILQYDTQGDLVFQHACQGKESMFEGSGPKNQNNYNFIREAYEERRKYWSGTIYSWSEMSEDESNFAKIYIGKYNYTRINLGSRILELLDGGEIGEGKASCERRWSVRMIDNKPTIVAIGSQHKDSEVASFFAKDDGDSKNFSGSWTIFEKCDITLEKIS
jgi:hypothetical protein